MADFFISNDGNDSTGDGSASNPWKTIDKAIGSGKGVGATPSVATDVWLRGGDTFREAVTMGVEPSAGAPLRVIGDVDGAAFDGAGGTGKTGVVQWSAWSDATTQLSDSCFTASSGKSNTTFQWIKFIGGDHARACVSLTTCSDFEFADCSFMPGAATGSSKNLFYAQTNESLGSGLKIRRCDFVLPVGGTTTGFNFTIGRAASVAYNLDALLENCRFIGGVRGAYMSQSGGGGAAVGYGFSVVCCTFFSQTSRSVGVDGDLFGSGAATVTGCLFLDTATGLWSTTSGQVNEDYNAINAITARTNVSAGAHSIVGVEPAVYFDDWRLDGEPARPFLEPAVGSPVLGFLPRPVGLSVDLFGRSRPNPCAAGCLESVTPDPPDPPAPGGNTYIFQTEG